MPYAALSVGRRKRPNLAPMLANPLLARLGLTTNLSDQDLLVLQEACGGIQTYAARADLVGEDEGTDNLHILLDGWACRYRIIENGRRQLPALLIPGDICDLDGLLLRRVHYGVAALTPCRVAVIAHTRIHPLLDENPALRDVFWWLTFVENAISAEWNVGLGRRSTDERLAHLLCELLVRHGMVGLSDGNSYQLPLTQEELSDTLGVSTVHVNRTLQELRRSGLVSLEDGRLTIHNWEMLKERSGFSSNYLHVEGLRRAASVPQAH